MIPDSPDTDIPESFDIDALVGEEFDFYGVDNNCFKLDDTIYEAIEDENDGYRSMLGCVEIRDAKDKIFFVSPVARVVVEHYDGPEANQYGFLKQSELYKLIDLHDGHEWLSFGTANSDDYYPWFVFDYSPKSPVE